MYPKVLCVRLWIYKTSVKACLFLPPVSHFVYCQLSVHSLSCSVRYLDFDHSHLLQMVFTFDKISEIYYRFLKGLIETHIYINTSLFSELYTVMHLLAPKHHMKNKL